MAFPTASVTLTAAHTTNVTTHNNNLPATVNAGDLLIAGICLDGSAGTITWDNATAGTWTSLLAGTYGGGTGHLHIRYKIADGTEDGLNLQHTSGAAQQSASWCIRVENWHGTTPPELTSATDSGAADTAPNPPSLTPSWGANDNLWFAGCAVNDDSNLSAYPANYTLDQTEHESTGAGGINQAFADRELNAGSEDPAAFTWVSNIRWVAWTLAIRPAAGGTTDRRAHIYWTELETPNEPRRALITFTELETPDAPRRAQIYWAELETPDEPRRGQIYWLEFEVPDAAVTDRRALISWVELEVPDEPRRAIVSWTELETPDEPRRAIISWLELETPDVPTLTFSDYGSAFLFTAANWKSSVAAYFEVYMKATAGTVYARLWDISTGAVVTDSLLSTGDSAFQRLRSTVISLSDGHEYIVQVGKDGADAGEIKSGRVVLVN